MRLTKCSATVVGIAWANFYERMIQMEQPDIDICSSCGEHTEFEEGQSNCCGAKPYDSDPDDVDMER